RSTSLGLLLRRCKSIGQGVGCPDSMTGFERLKYPLRVVCVKGLSVTAPRCLVGSRPGKSHRDVPRLLDVRYAALRDSWQSGQANCWIRRSRPSRDDGLCRVSGIGKHRLDEKIRVPKGLPRSVALKVLTAAW